MYKYLTVFTISWQNEFIYRINFILWRFRNVLRFLMTYFLWSGIFISSRSVFGYSQTQMFTYVFMVLIVSSIVLSSPSSDNIGGEIANGDLSNYLLKPLGYLKYWFTRDLSSKLLNLIFSTIEISILLILLRPEILFPTNFFNLVAFLISIIFGVVLYFLVNVSTRMIAFWTPENTWGFAFVILVFTEILGGGIFPLDILPVQIKFLLQLTPFPYLVFYPIAIFLGKVQGIELIRILAQSFVWVFLMIFVTKLIWKKGLLIYSSEGR